VRPAEIDLTARDLLTIKCCMSILDQSMTCEGRRDLSLQKIPPVPVGKGERARRARSIVTA